MDPLLTAVLSAIERGGTALIPLTIFLAILWWRATAALDKEQTDAKKAQKEYQDELKELTRRASDGLNNASNSIDHVLVYMGMNRQERRSPE
jgi:membrane protein implicated in regulation of membrane protease activity